MYTCVNIGLSNPEWHRTSQAEAALNAQLAAEEAIRYVKGGTWDTELSSRETHMDYMILHVFFVFSQMFPFHLNWLIFFKCFLMKMQVEWMAFVHVYRQV